MSSAGVAVIREHPTAFLWASTKALAGTAFGINNTFFDYLDIDPTPTWLAVLSRALLVVGWVLAAIGFVWAWWKHPGDRVGHATAAWLVAYTVVVGSAVGPAYSRMRAPVMPILVLYLAGGLWFLVTGLRDRGRSERVAAADDREPQPEPVAT
jgi:hypothetical protein